MLRWALVAVPGIAIVTGAAYAMATHFGWSQGTYDFVCFVGGMPIGIAAVLWAMR